MKLKPNPCEVKNEQSSSYGERWASGDIIGTMIDFQNREITFFRMHRGLSKEVDDGIVRIR
jgi:hypothetical protein